jgi:hypothetical protein
MTAPLAYIIMPVGSDKMFDAKRAIIEDSANHNCWITHFPLDSSSRASATVMTLPKIKNTMNAAALIVADLSLERPSCYYELGVAQALGRRTFLLAAAGTAIHQVSDRDKVHFYVGLDELRALVDGALSELTR